MGRYLSQLSQTNVPVRRASYFTAAIENASQISEMPPKASEELAKYVLSPKADEEQEAIASAVSRVGRWKTVRLALADSLLETSLREDVVCETIGLVLDQTIEPRGGQAWRQSLRLMLMRSVLQGTETSENKHPYDIARDTINAMYQAQARALGINKTPGAGTSPTEILPLMIELLASRLSQNAASESNREFLSRVPHELAVAEYLGDDDLRRLVLLDRIWLRLLAVETAQIRTERADQAQTILDRVEESDRRAGDVLIQLRDGQAAILQMWLLRAP
jgi:hypothetical protein